MNILELAILKKMVGGGGGSGTDNYNDLLNLPQINGETLAGNKTAGNLGLQDALTFDSTPTEDSANPVESGGVYNALAGKQDNLTFDGVYNASTNKAATESTVTNAINGLDVSGFSVDADETISSISETDGKISVTKQDIAIASNQVVAMTGYTKPSSAPATPAIQQSDTANVAIGKLEYKADVNQTNILYSLQTGVKNIIKLPAGIYKDNVATFTVTNDGEILISSTSSSASAVTINTMDLPAGDYVYWYDNTASSGACDVRLMNGSTRLSREFTLSSATTISIAIFSYATNSNISIKPMLCTAAAWAQEPNVYRKPALPNSDLTYLQAEDRAALAEVVDSGAKNLLDTSISTVSSITWTADSDGYITASPNNTDTRGWSYSSAQYKVRLKPGTYVCMLDIKTASNQGGLGVSMYTSSGVNVFSSALPEIQNKTGIVTWEFTLSGTYDCGIIFKCYDMVACLMICTKAAFGVSKTFVPYRMPYSQALALLNTRAPSGIADYVSSGSADDLPSGCALCSPNVTGKPISDNYFIIRTRIYDANCAEQEAIAPAGNRRFNRTKWGGTWTSWAEYAIKS